MLGPTLSKGLAVLLPAAKFRRIAYLRIDASVINTLRVCLDHAVAAPSTLVDFIARKNLKTDIPKLGGALTLILPILPAPQGSKPQFEISAGLGVERLSGRAQHVLHDLRRFAGNGGCGGHRLLHPHRALFLFAIGAFELRARRNGAQRRNAGIGERRVGRAIRLALERIVVPPIQQLGLDERGVPTSASRSRCFAPPPVSRARNSWRRAVVHYELAGRRSYIWNAPAIAAIAQS